MQASTLCYEPSAASMLTKSSRATRLLLDNLSAELGKKVNNAKKRGVGGAQKPRPVIYRLKVIGGGGSDSKKTC